MPITVRLTGEELDRIIDECRRSYPLEACGALVGSIVDQEAVIYHAIPLRNIKESPSSFEIDTEELWRVIMEAEAKGQEFLGFFHSHPAPSRPSEEDLKHMRLWNGTIWLIISMDDWSVSAYRAGEEAEKVRIIRT